MEPPSDTGMLLVLEESWPTTESRSLFTAILRTPVLCLLSSSWMFLWTFKAAYNAAFKLLLDRNNY